MMLPCMTLLAVSRDIHMASCGSKDLQSLVSLQKADLLVFSVVRRLELALSNSWSRTVGCFEMAKGWSGFEAELSSRGSQSPRVFTGAHIGRGLFEQAGAGTRV